MLQNVQIHCQILLAVNPANPQLTITFSRKGVSNALGTLISLKKMVSWEKQLKGEECDCPVTLNWFCLKKSILNICMILIIVFTIISNFEKYPCFPNVKR